MKQSRLLMGKEKLQRGREHLARFYHETIGRGVSEVRSVAATSTLSKLEVGDHFLSVIPNYVSQLADAKKAKIAGFYGRISDAKAAKKFGAKDLDEFSYWSWRSCGIVDIQMVLNAVNKGKEKGTTMDFIREGLSLRGYNVKKDIGWYHNSLVKLAQNHGLYAETKKFIPSNKIASYIEDECFILASVKSERGHLLLVYGFKLLNGGKVDGFWVHDSNNYFKKGESKFVRKTEFDKIFTRRIIVLGGKHG